MKIPTWLEAVLAVALVLAGIAWFRAHDALRDALAQKDVLQHERGDLQARIDSAGTVEHKANDLLEKARKKPATHESVIGYLPQPLPEGSSIEIRPSPPSNGMTFGTDDLVLHGDPQKNLNWLQDMEIKCKECDNSLQARNAQFADLEKQLQLSDQNAKNWQKAAQKGSGFWQRAKEWGIRAGFAAGGFEAGRLMHK